MSCVTCAGMEKANTCTENEAPTRQPVALNNPLCVPGVAVRGTCIVSQNTWGAPAGGICVVSTTFSEPSGSKASMPQPPPLHAHVAKDQMAALGIRAAGVRHPRTENNVGRGSLPLPLPFCLLPLSRHVPPHNHLFAANIYFLLSLYFYM